MKGNSPYREKKDRLLVLRDRALAPHDRVRLGAAQATAARVVFMAGMAARGFTRAEALRAWRDAAARGE